MVFTVRFDKLQTADIHRRGNATLMRSKSDLRFLITQTALLVGLLSLATSTSLAQNADGNQVATAKAATTEVNKPAESHPLFADYHGVKIGMATNEVRAKLDKLQNKSKTQDFFVLSDAETAQVFYDESGKVSAISVDYSGKQIDVPSAVAVLGEEAQPRPDGSFYALKRYPTEGFWISYYRGAGSNLRVTITWQKM